MDISIGSISFEEFKSFVSLVEKDFVPPLLSRIEINSYYDKLSKYATIIVCRKEAEIVGMCAMYDNNRQTKKGYITFIAVKNGYRGIGLAGLLINAAKSHAAASGMDILGIETNNVIARDCYLKNGFRLIESHLVDISSIERYYLEYNLN